jgi:hypothetical protein
MGTCFGRVPNNGLILSPQLDSGTTHRPTTFIRIIAEPSSSLSLGTGT